MRSVLLAGVGAGLLAIANGAERAALSPDEALETFRTPDGLEVELVAAEPLVESPAAIAFDERQQLYVAENRGYPNFGDEKAGRIALLKDTDGDGRMDKRATFASGLTFPNGVLPWRGGVIVTCAPDVLYLKDTDGDSIADERRVLLTGFDATKSTQLRVNAPTLGPDGWVYFAAGLVGGTITSPEHPEMPAVKMTGDLRWHPDTGAFENVDGRSQYGMTFDAFGRRFICMNRLPVQHVVLTSSVLARNPLLAFSETVQDCNERSVKTGLKGGGDGVKLFPISANITTADSHAGSFSAACGVFAWVGGALPPAYNGAIFACDPTGNLVHVDRLEPNGATFTARPLLDGMEFLASTDDWFRPVFLSSGPDGALYVTDMYRKVIEHPDYLPEEVRKRTDFETGRNLGRIWRVKGRGTKAQPALPADQAGWVKNAAEIISSSPGWPAHTAFRLLRDATSAELIDSAKKTLKQTGLPAEAYATLLRALAIEEDFTFSTAALAHPHAGVREVALQLLLEHPQQFSTALALSTDPNPRVRALVAGVLDNVHELNRIDALAEIAAKSGGDKWTAAIVLSGAKGSVLSLIGAVQAKSVQDTPMPTLFSLAGRLIAAGNECASADELASRIRSSGENGFALLAGFAEGKNLRLTEASPAVQRILQNAATAARHDRPPASAFALLARAAWPVAREPLLHASSSEDPETATAALRTLAGFDSPEAVPAVLTSDRWIRYTPAEREIVLSAVLSRRGNFAAVLDAIEGEAISSGAIPLPKRDAFLKSGDEIIRKRAEKVFGSAIGTTAEALAKAKASLALKADPAKGREVFRMLCASCHRLDREGHAVGPDLLDIRNQPKENILFHIVSPDAEMAPAFTAYAVETNDGRTLAGILTSENTGSITVKLPMGLEETLLRSNLKSLNALPGSLMPAGLQSGTDLQGLADLLAFLKGE